MDAKSGISLSLNDGFTTLLFNVEVVEFCSSFSLLFFNGMVNERFTIATCKPTNSNISLSAILLVVLVLEDGSGEDGY